MTRKFMQLFKLAAMALIPVFVFALTGASPAHAGGVVTNCSSDADLNTKLAGGGTVTFNCGTKTIPWSGTKTIAANTTIDGGNTITFNAAGGSRLFVVNSGVTLTLQNVTLASGYNPDSNGGAAVRNNGHLNLANVTVRNMLDSAFNGGGISTTGVVEIFESRFYDNKATNGGAIYANGPSAAVTISYSDLYNNTATGTNTGVNGFGGAIYAQGGATVNVNNSTIHDNEADTGGAIYISGATTHLNMETSHLDKNSADNKGAGILNDGVAVLTDMTLDGNICEGTCLGGGIYNYRTLALSNATLMNNQAYYGGGLSSAFGTATLTNVTISGNTASAYGGAVDNYRATTYLTNVTLAKNSAGTGGAILNENFTEAKLYMTNVLVANSKSGGNCLLTKAPIVSDHNLSSDATCNFGAGRDSVKLKLGPLETNGGLTLTHRLLSGNPAIEGGVFVNTILTDQRTVTRPQGTVFDVGAVEFVPCNGTPTKPQLLAPIAGTVVTVPQATLDWAGPDCAKMFSVVLRRDSKKGAVVFTKSNIKPTQVKTSPLTAGHKYFWQVKTCIGSNCSSSSWAKFKVEN